MFAKLGDVIACVTETDSVNYRGLQTLRATLDTPACVELGQRLIDEEGWFLEATLEADQWRGPSKPAPPGVEFVQPRMNRTEKAAWLAKLAAADTSTAAERAELEQAERERLARLFAVRSPRERLRVLRENAEAYRSRGEPIDAMIAQAEAELAAAGNHTPKGNE